ncbi:hypothetical protein D3C85_1455010 [compost metagenome]
MISIDPSLRFKVMNPVASGVTKVKATSAGFTITPFTVSLFNTFKTPITWLTPFIGPAVSSTASIVAALTTMVTLALSQFDGFNFSQIV